MDVGSSGNEAVLCTTARVQRRQLSRNCYPAVCTRAERFPPQQLVFDCSKHASNTKHRSHHSPRNPTRHRNQPGDGTVIAGCRQAYVHLKLHAGDAHTLHVYVEDSVPGFSDFLAGCFLSLLSPITLAVTATVTHVNVASDAERQHTCIVGRGDICLVREKKKNPTYFPSYVLDVSNNSCP